MNELTEKQYRQLKRDVEESKAAAERARGALEQTIKTLKEEFEVENIKQAKNKLLALELKATTSQKEFERAFKDYEEKWKHDDDRE